MGPTPRTDYRYTTMGECLRAKGYVEGVSTSDDLVYLTNKCKDLVVVTPQLGQMQQRDVEPMTNMQQQQQQPPPAAQMVAAPGPVASQPQQQQKPSMFSMFSRTGGKRKTNRKRRTKSKKSKKSKRRRH